MAHFAKVEGGTVTQVIVAEQDYINTFSDKDKWVQTSYNTRGGKHYNPATGKVDSGTPLRKNYAGIGYKYDQSADAFHAPRPTDRNGKLCESWTLNTDTYYWQAPKEYPNDGKQYNWDESSTSWVELGSQQPG